MQQTERELWRLFKSIDRNSDGRLDKGELQAAFLRAGLVVPNSKLNQFFTEVDSNRDGVISFDEWRYVRINQPSFCARERVLTLTHTGTFFCSFRPRPLVLKLCCRTTRRLCK